MIPRYARPEMAFPQIEGMKFPSQEDRQNESIEKVMRYLNEHVGSESICICDLNLAIQFPVPLKLTPSKLESRPGESLVSLSGVLMGGASVFKFDA